MLLHGRGGLTTNYRTLAAPLAAQGYVAFVPDYFTPIGMTFEKFDNTYWVWAIDPTREILGNGLEALKSLSYVDQNRIGVVGTSLGGYFAFILDTREDVKDLAEHRRPLRMELLILYPYDMVIKRWLANPTVADALTKFFGTVEWQKEYKKALALNELSEEQQARFVSFYMENLKALGYRYVEPFKPLGYKQRSYYHMIFAGDHPVGAKIMKDVWSKARPLPDQLDYQPLKRPSK